MFLNYLNVLVVALIGGILGTNEGIKKLANASFSAPCYLRPFLNTNFTSTFTIKNQYALLILKSLKMVIEFSCCGKNENITHYTDLLGFCMDPKEGGGMVH